MACWRWGRNSVNLSVPLSSGKAVQHSPRLILPTLAAQGFQPSSGAFQNANFSKTPFLHENPLLFRKTAKAFKTFVRNDLRFLLSASPYPQMAHFRKQSPLFRKFCAPVFSKHLPPYALFSPTGKPNPAKPSPKFLKSGSTAQRHKYVRRYQQLR